MATTEIDRRRIALRRRPVRGVGRRAGAPANLTPPGPPRLRIAMIGQKGVPATFGGVEHHVEELGSRLAALGHEVTVYCRSSYENAGEPTYRGMRLRHQRTAGTKHLDAIAHSATATLAAFAERPDIVHYHALGPGLLAPLPRYLSNSRVVLTVHGLDNERAKWGRMAKVALGTAHWMSARVPDRTVVVSRALAAHYAEVYGKDTSYIPNGVERPEPRGAERIIAQYGLSPGSYVLFVARLVPEKAPDLLIRAYRRVVGDVPLVIVGDSSFTDGYVARLHQLAHDDPRVKFTGYVYGDLLAELYSNAATFALPSYLEGLPLTLLEALSYGTPVVASEIPPQLEVLHSSGAGHRLFPSGDERALAGELQRVLAGQPEERRGASEVRDRVLDEYCWDDATRRLEELYLELVGARRRTGERELTGELTGSAG